MTRIVFIEHADALTNLDDILDVPGIDVAYLASNELSMNMGYPDHSDVLSAIEKGERKTREKGVALGGVAT